MYTNSGQPGSNEIFPRSQNESKAVYHKKSEVNPLDELELDEEIRLKQLSLDIFLDAKRRMTHALEVEKNLNEWEKMVSNLGEAVLTEHSEWYKMHRSHPATIPWGG